MSTLVVIFFILYILFFFGIFFIGTGIQRLKESQFAKDENPIKLEEIAVVIPFRNEENRIRQLLESINSSVEQPKLYLFVDDHSTDKSVGIIVEKLITDNYRIVQLPVNLIGKKRAIRFGIEQVEVAYILTMDADISFAPDYFSHLELLDKKDMYVLPVIMKTNSLRSNLFAMDHLLATLLNSGLAGISRPVMASGANFLFKREKYLKLHRLESHVHIQSGDDTFLLRDFRNGKASVGLISHPGFAVQTETPENLKELFRQRVRWIGKTKDMGDQFATAIALLQGTFSITFISILIFYLVSGSMKMAFVVFLSKIILDMFVLLPGFNKYRKLKSWLLLPLYEMVFPLYTTILLLLAITKKQEWKGRAQE